MKTAIVEKALLSGACAVGVVKARKFLELLPILKKRGPVSFCEKDFEKRINPFLIMENAKSIIVCLFSYNTNEKSNISEYAVGEDYHLVIKKRLLPVLQILSDNLYRAEIFADNGPLCDRYLAYLAGLGFFGKNTMLINPEYGSKVFIGYILTDCELEPDKPMNNSICMNCMKCVNTCPSHAIGKDFEFNENVCVSFLTQKKGALSDKEERFIKSSKYIWGCDICTDVCPYNYSLPITNIQEFLPSAPYPDENLKNLSNKEFNKLYSNKAYSWRGKNILIRNMDICK